MSGIAVSPSARSRAGGSAVPPTIRDVARAAGVSVATVSRALNGQAHILPTTRERILEVARELRFVPSWAARNLTRRRSDTIGAVLPDLHGEYFSELIRGIDQAARARGLHLLLSSSHGSVDQAARAIAAMHGRVDGLLVMESRQSDEHLLREALPVGLPVVTIGPRSLFDGGVALGVDNRHGAQRMTEHLLACGHRRIDFIGGPPDHPEALERREGYRAALAAAPSPGRPESGSAANEPREWPGQFTEESGWLAGRRIAALAERPDAVFAANDLMAIGCIAALLEAGAKVPQDIAVTGFDDLQIARYVQPALTTMRVPIARMGALALQALDERVRGAAALAEIVEATPARLPPELIVRASCGARASHVAPAPAAIGQEAAGGVAARTPG